MEESKPARIESRSPAKQLISSGIFPNSVMRCGLLLLQKAAPIDAGTAPAAHTRKELVRIETEKNYPKVLDVSSHGYHQSAR